MNRLKITSSLVTLVALLSIVAVSVQEQTAQQTPLNLGIEIATPNGMLYVPASATHKVSGAHILVPAVPSTRSVKDQVSAVRIIPQMVGGKVKVTVYAVYGDISAAKSCRDLKSFKASTVASYLAGDGETITVNELNSRGITLEGVLTFRVVSNKAILAPASTAATDCICSLCKGIGCCPSEGECIHCQQCGIVCCFN